MDDLNLENNKKTSSRIYWVFLYTIVFTLAGQITYEESILTSFIWAISAVLFFMFLVYPSLNRIKKIYKLKIRERKD